MLTKRTHDGDPADGPRRPRRHRDDGTPDGHDRLELTKFHAPEAVRGKPDHAPANTLGLRSIMFAVDDVDATLGGLRAHGAEFVEEVVQQEDSYRL